MICSIFTYLIDYTKALLTAVKVYLIGFYYFLYEFNEDCQTGLKTVRQEALNSEKLKTWRKALTKFQEEQNQDVQQQEEEKEADGPRQLVAVLTGADGTIGSEILNYLISLDFFVFAIGSSPPANFTYHPDLQFVKCDLSARNEVFEAVETVNLSCDQIDLLILNAAIMLQPGFGLLPFPYRRDFLGEKIIERHLSINVLANAQIFASLSSRLERSILPNPRAIFVSSSTAHAGDISLLLRDEERFWCRHLNGYKAYADSKLLLSVYVKYLARILKAKGSRISVASVHPGVVPGKLYRNVFRPIRFLINYVIAPFMRSPKLAASFVLDLAFTEQIQEGDYYENGKPASLKAIEDPDQVWMIGRSVRDMIVDANDGNTSSFLIENGQADQTLYESIPTGTNFTLFSQD